MPDRERLQLGRAPRRKPPKRNPWDGAPFGTRIYRRWKARHEAKKRRIAAMSPGRRLARRFGVIGTWLLASMATLSVIAVVLFYALSDVPRPESLPLPQVVQIQYADGSVMARIGTQNRTIVSLDKVPETVRWAVLAAEDRTFYQDPGVSLKGTVRAAVSDLTGGDTQGGSGITQQYAKNAYLNNSRTLSRKLRELAIAVKLTRQYSKDQILEFYLNTVYFGRGAYGIQAAAQTYFGTSVTRLNTAQGAVLAALLRAPSYYDPGVHPQAARARWHYVLDGMVATKHLTADGAAQLAYPRVARPRDNGLGTTGSTALIVQRVLAELSAHGISPDEASVRGMTIRTTIDPKAQQAALTAINTTFANLTPQQRNLKNALVAIDPSSGAVLAYYGGRNGRGYNGKIDNNDYAAIGSRPPGSSFKPYTLATVLTQTLHKEKQKKPLTITSYVDGSYCTTIQGKRICNDPRDEGVSSPSISIRNAMLYSLNTTFDKLAVEAGPNNVAALAHAAGVSKTDAYGNPTLVEKNGDTGFGIGIGDYAVHPIDQAAGFATFAANGMRHRPYFVQTATASNGDVVYRHKNIGLQVIDPKVANDVTLTMQPIAAYSGDGLAGGRVSAAKTGTKGIGGDSLANSDAWMVGYTPQVSAAVWVGSGNSVTPIYNAYGGAEYGADLPGKTWKLFMDTYLAAKPFLPMATHQMITGGVDLAPRPAPSPTKATSSKPKPKPSSSGNTAPSSPAPSTPTPSATPSPIVPSPTCTSGILGSPCPSTPAPGG